MGGFLSGCLRSAQHVPTRPIYTPASPPVSPALTPSPVPTQVDNSPLIQRAPATTSHVNSEPKAISQSVPPSTPFAPTPGLTTHDPDPFQRRNAETPTRSTSTPQTKTKGASQHRPQPARAAAAAPKPQSAGAVATEFESDDGWSTAGEGGKTVRTKRTATQYTGPIDDVKIIDIPPPEQKIDEYGNLKGHASGMNFKIMRLPSGGKEKEVLVSHRGQWDYKSIGFKEQSKETPRACSEQNALFSITEKINPAVDGVEPTSILGIALQTARDTNPNHSGLRLKINMRNSSLRPCIASTPENPGIPCNTYLPQFVQRIKTMYPGLDVRIKVANPTVQFRRFDAGQGKTVDATTLSGVTRYGYDNPHVARPPRDGFNKKAPKDFTWADAIRPVSGK
jgi:hypothetical protein